MKRCPECLFIYPDSDARCDFDNTPLVVVDDAELEAATTSQDPVPPRTKKGGARKRAAQKRPAREDPPKRGPRKRPRKAPIVASVGLAFGLVAFFVYYGVGERAGSADEQIAPVASVAAVVAPAPVAVVAPSPVPVETASPSPSPESVVKPAADRTATSHSRTTVAPVSTSGSGMGKRPGGKPVILLTSGSRIEADEVWRTRDGVWYRRAGIVTLLKAGRVKAIVNQ